MGSNCGSCTQNATGCCSNGIERSFTGQENLRNESSDARSPQKYDTLWYDEGYDSLTDFQKLILEINKKS